MSCFYRILKSAVVQLHLNHVTACRFHRLLNGNWYFTRFTTSEADLSFTVTDNRQGRETEDSTALDNFGNAVDLNQLLLEIAFLLLFFLIVKSHMYTLEFQSGFTSGIGQCLNTPVILIPTAVKSNSCDTGFHGSFGYQFANLRRRRNIARGAFA